MSEDAMDSFERLISRRELVVRTGGALSLATVGGGLLRAGEALAADARARRISSGGTLVFGLGANLDGFDPPKWATPTGGFTALAVFNTLIEPTYEGALTPGLVAAMPTLSRGGTLFTFRLRRGVQFHHGREVNSEDVKFSIERLLNPKTAAGGAGYYTSLHMVGLDKLLNEKAETISGIKTPDEHIVTIEMEAPESALVPLLSLWFSSIVPKDVVTQLGEKKFNVAPIGTGPFKVRSAVLSKGATLVRNPHYFKPGLPHLDGVKMTVGVDPELSILRIQRGQQDLMAEPMPKADFVRLHNDPKYRDQVKIAATHDVNYLALSTKHPAMKNLKVRQAIAMAVDKERLVRAIAGRGTVADGGLFGPYSPFHQKGLAYPYNPDKAKQLLKEAGFPNGFKVEFWGRNYSPYLEIGQTVQQDLGRIGIKVDVHQPVLSALYTETAKYPPIMQENNWEQPYPHGSVVIDGGFTSAAVKSGCCNLSSYTSPKLDKLAQRGHEALSRADIVRVYKEIDRLVIRDEALWVPLFYPKRADFVSARIRGYRVPLDIGDAKRFVNYSVA